MLLELLDRLEDGIAVGVVALVEIQDARLLRQRLLRQHLALVGDEADGLPRLRQEQVQLAVAVEIRDHRAARAKDLIAARARAERSADLQKGLEALLEADRPLVVHIGGQRDAPLLARVEVERREMEPLHEEDPQDMQIRFTNLVPRPASEQAKRKARQRQRRDENQGAPLHVLRIQSSYSRSTYDHSGVARSSESSARKSAVCRSSNSK